MLYADFFKRLDGFDLNIHIEADNTVIGLFGPSGAGKSMTLKCIAGIEKPDRGVIRLDDRILFDSEQKIDLPPQKRKVGYLFQDYALFPNMTVRGNVTAGMHALKKQERKAKADELMERFRISHLADVRPDRLSGGERQRTALARIFASDPELLLLDEPFSSLDTMLKFELIPFVKDTVRSYAKTCLMVSHDVNEICAVCADVSTISAGTNTPPIDAEKFMSDIREKYADIGAKMI